jgi:hypothetical protein
MRAPAAAVGDLADLLHVHVHQLPGPVPLVAAGGLLGGADQLPGQRIAVSQVGQLVAAQYPRHRAGRHAELGRQPVRSSAVLAPSCYHRGLDGGLVRLGLCCGRDDRSCSPASPSAA